MAVCHSARLRRWSGILVYWEWQTITGYDKYGLLELAAPAAVAAAMVFVILNFSVWESVIPALFAALFCSRRLRAAEHSLLVSFRRAICDRAGAGDHRTAGR